jgi:hypothetical protein
MRALSRYVLQSGWRVKARRDAEIMRGCEFHSSASSARDCPKQLYSLASDKSAVFVEISNFVSA